MPRTRHFPLWCFCWALTLATCTAAEQDVTCRDWYFRESLAAIRDWEDLLGRWEQETPDSARTPVLPVPATGEAVAWPNPIPLRLLPLGRDIRIGASSQPRREDDCRAIPARSRRRRRTRSQPERRCWATSTLAAAARTSGTTLTTASSIG